MRLSATFNLSKLARSPTIPSTSPPSHISVVPLCSPGTSNLKPLSNRHTLGLLPFVKEMTILRQCNDYSWLLPRFFLHRDPHLFFAFTNVQSLTVESLEIHKFIPELNRYFGHLSPTLRSLTLHIPHGTPRHLSHFISLFPNLNDVKIRSLIHSGPGVPDDTLVPFSAPKFEGRLTLLSFAAEADETWEQLATSTFVPRVALKISEQRMRELKYAVGKVNTDLPLLGSYPTLAHSSPPEAHVHRQVSKDFWTRYPMETYLSAANPLSRSGTPLVP